MSDMPRDYKLDADAEIARLREKVETLMTERVTPAVTQLASQAQDVADAATDKVRENAERLSETIKAQPLTAIGVAALVGFLFAGLVRR